MLQILKYDIGFSNQAIFDNNLLYYYNCQVFIVGMGHIHTK